MGRMKSRFALASAALVAAGCFSFACRKEEAPAPEQAAASAPSSAAAAPPAASAELVNGGRYLVIVMACNDCHTPFKMGKNGPEPDMSRMLSGHPENMKMLPPMPWEWFGKMRDQELKAIFAYLKSIPPIHNRVPDPEPPAAAK